MDDDDDGNCRELLDVNYIQAKSSAFTPPFADTYQTDRPADRVNTRPINSIRNVRAFPVPIFYPLASSKLLLISFRPSTPTSPSCLVSAANFPPLRVPSFFSFIHARIYFFLFAFHVFYFHADDNAGSSWTRTINHPRSNIAAVKGLVVIL